MPAEGPTLNFYGPRNRREAEVTAEINKTVENMRARRLYTVIELIMEDIVQSASLVTSW